MSGKDGVGQVIKAALDHMLRLTRGTRDALGPAQLANGLIALHIIDEILDVDLHAWTSVRDCGIGCRQYLDNVTLEKANLSMAYMENALVGPDSHEDCSFAPAVTLEGHGCPKPSMGM